MMQLLERIKSRFFNSVLEQRGAFKVRERKLMNFELAKTFAIIYDSTIPGNDIVITKTVEFLKGKGKTVSMLAFLNDKTITQKDEVDIFNAKDINWYGVPRNERVDAFCAKQFDVLFCAFIEPNKPLEYIAHISNAHCRMGLYNGQNENAFELMINDAPSLTLQQLLQSMVSLLNQLKL